MTRCSFFVSRTKRRVTYFTHRSAFVALTLFSAGIGAQSEQESQTAQAELLAVNSAIENIRSWIDEASSEASVEEKDLRAAELELSSVTQSISDLQNDINQIQLRADALQQESAALSAEKEQKVQVIHEILNVLYRQKNPSALQRFLEQDDFKNTERLNTYSRIITETQQAQLEEFLVVINALEQNQTELDAELAQLTVQQQQLNTEQTRLALVNGAKADALKTLQDQIGTRTEELAALALNQQQLTQLIEEIRTAMEGIRSFADVPPIKDSQGSLSLPVNGRITSRFGEPYGGGSLVRQGIGIAAPLGTAVKSIHPGHVVFADWLRGSGLLVIVDHGEGYMSLYGGNEALSASSGDWVDADEIIATSGTPVNASIPSLYFELRYRGEPQNPASWLDMN